MLVETLESRRLFAASPLAAVAQAGGVADMAKASPSSVAALARPDVGPTLAAAIPSQASPAAGAAQAGTIDDTARADGRDVAELARP